jgi:phenol hydroxylase P2 protein
MSNVFIALQTNEETRPIVEAIMIDNPHAVVKREPAMIKIDAPGQMIVRKETIEGLVGRTFDLQEMHIHLITLSGNVDETDDSLTLTWNN